MNLNENEHIEGYSVKDIAELFGKTRAFVYQHMRKGDLKWDWIEEEPAHGGLPKYWFSTETVKDFVEKMNRPIQKAMVMPSTVHVLVMNQRDVDFVESRTYESYNVLGVFTSTTVMVNKINDIMSLDRWPGAVEFEPDRSTCLKAYIDYHTRGYIKYIYFDAYEHEVQNE